MKSHRSLVLAILAMFACVSRAPAQRERAPARVDRPAADARVVDLEALRAKTARPNQLVRVIVELPPGMRSIGRVSGQALGAPAAKAALEASMRALGAVLIKPLPDLPLVVVEVNRVQLDALLRLPGVLSVSEDRVAEPSLMDSGPLVHAPQAAAMGARGSGWVVAILDTGIDKAHPFLSPRVVSEACYSSDSIVDGTTAICPSGSSGPGSGQGVPCTVAGPCNHGTHVAGIAAGKAAGTVSYNGTAPEAGIISIQVFSATATNLLSFESDLIQALNHVLTLAGSMSVASVNMSLGGGAFAAPCDSGQLKPVIDQLKAVGVATIIATGNNGLTTQIAWPSCISTALPVAATTKLDTMWPSSNHNALVDLLAPGASITSSVPNGNSAAFSGTSMAAPHVAGAFAALRSRSPAATPLQIETALAATGVPITHPTNGITRPRILLDAAARHLTDVWMKDLPADTGLEPDPAAAGMPLWESTDIWVRNSQDAVLAHQHQHQNPEIGAANHLYVKTRNKGIAPGSGWLSVYWANASLNLDNPAQWNLMGSQNLTSVAPGESVVEFPWASLPGQGHFCILARWTESQVPLSFTSVGQAVGSSNDLVWRNMNIVDLSRLMAGASQAFAVTARGLKSKDAYIVFASDAPVGDGASWPRSARALVSIDPRVAEGARNVTGAVKALGDGRFDLTLGGGTATIGPLNLEPGQETKLGVEITFERAAAGVAAASMARDAVLRLRVMEATAEGAQQLGRNPRMRDATGLVGGVTYEMRIPAMSRGGDGKR